MDLSIGDIVTLKKKHPCGGNTWEILRVGMDLRLQCTVCKHHLFYPRKQIEKNITNIQKKS